MTFEWNSTRRLQLVKLQRLIAEVKAMNHGSGIIQRIQECERLADELSTDDFATPEASFLSFLRIESVKDHKP